MSELLIQDAIATIEASPLLQAVADFTICAGKNITGYPLESAATVIVASRTPPDPTTLLHLADLMADHARTYRAAIAALGFADVPMERAEHEARRDRALAGMRAAFTSGGSNG